MLPFLEKKNQQIKPAYADTQNFLFDTQHWAQRSLLFHYIMNEGGGNIVFDLSKNRKNGIFQSSGPLWQNNGLLFNGTSDYISLSPDSSINNLSVFSFCGWIFPQAWNEAYIIFKWVTGSGWELRLMNAGGEAALRGWMKGSILNAESHSSNNSISLNKWQFVCFNFDYLGDKIIHIYINGKEVTYSLQTALNGTLGDNSSAELNIGWGWMTRYFQGYIDNVRFYNRILTQTEIAALYAEKYPEWR